VSFGPLAVVGWHQGRIDFNLHEKLILLHRLSKGGGKRVRSEIRYDKGKRERGGETEREGVGGRRLRWKKRYERKEGGKRDLSFSFDPSNDLGGFHKGSEGRHAQGPIREKGTRRFLAHVIGGGGETSSGGSVEKRLPISASIEYINNDKRKKEVKEKMVKNTKEEGNTDGGRSKKT